MIVGVLNALGRELEDAGVSRVVITTKTEGELYALLSKIVGREIVERPLSDIKVGIGGLVIELQAEAS